MYNLNPLNRFVLITSNEVIFHGATGHTVDSRNIDQAIIIAEERFIKKTICKEFYEDFRNKKNVIVTAGNLTALTTASGLTGLAEGDIVNAIELVSSSWYKTLWKEYLWKICAECVIYTATPTNFSEYTSQGEMINNPRNILTDGQGATSVNVKEVSWKMDKMLMDRIDPLLAAMHEWLCDNRGNFPYYNCKSCACTENGISTIRKTAWIHAYSNTDKNCCDD